MFNIQKLLTFQVSQGKLKWSASLHLISTDKLMGCNLGYKEVTTSEIRGFEPNGTWPQGYIVPIAVTLFQFSWTTS